MVQATNNRDPEHPWDDNLPKNKEYIQKFYKKSEQEIKQQENEGKIQNKGQGDNMSNASKIVKVKKNTDGDITDIMIDNGNVYSINEAIMMVRDGAIEGVNVGTAKNGRQYLRANPNGIDNDNLDNLPTF